jgi:hypothetical protein
MRNDEQHMAKFINRRCPKCRDHFCVAVSEWRTSKGEEYPVSGVCATCGYRLAGWRVILGRKASNRMLYSRLPNVLSSAPIDV